MIYIYIYIICRAFAPNPDKNVFKKPTQPSLHGLSLFQNLDNLWIFAENGGVVDLSLQNWLLWLMWLLHKCRCFFEARDIYLKKKKKKIERVLKHWNHKWNHWERGEKLFAKTLIIIISFFYSYSTRSAPSIFLWWAWSLLRGNREEMRRPISTGQGVVRHAPAPPCYWEVQAATPRDAQRKLRLQHSKRRRKLELPTRQV